MTLALAVPAASSFGVAGTESVLGWGSMAAAAILGMIVGMALAGVLATLSNRVPWKRVFAGVLQSSAEELDARACEIERLRGTVAQLQLESQQALQEIERATAERIAALDEMRRRLEAEVEGRRQDLERLAAREGDLRVEHQRRQALEEAQARAEETLQALREVERASAARIAALEQDVRDGARRLEAEQQRRQHLEEAHAERQARANEALREVELRLEAEREGRRIGLERIAVLEGDVRAERQRRQELEEARAQQQAREAERAGEERQTRKVRVFANTDFAEGHSTVADKRLAVTAATQQAYGAWLELNRETVKIARYETNNSSCNVPAYGGWSPLLDCSIVVEFYGEEVGRAA